jgi:dUTP pyrophosphatase
MPTINIQLMENSLAEYYKERNNHKTDSGYDLFCPETVIVPPNALGHTIDFQIRCSPQFEKISGYSLEPRSSISKTPLRMSNSRGIIDHEYRGNIMAKVDNRSNEPFEIKKGERLFQLLMPSLEPFNVSFVNQLDETARGTGGFGSTGK